MNPRTTRDKRKNARLAFFANFAPISRKTSFIPKRYGAIARFARFPCAITASEIIPVMLAARSARDSA
jgi:hypothetical protein